MGASHSPRRSRIAEMRPGSSHFGRHVRYSGHRMKFMAIHSTTSHQGIDAVSLQDFSSASASFDEPIHNILFAVALL